MLTTPGLTRSYTLMLLRSSASSCGAASGSGSEPELTVEGRGGGVCRASSHLAVK